MKWVGRLGTHEPKLISSSMLSSMRFAWSALGFVLFAIACDTATAPNVTPSEIDAGAENDGPDGSTGAESDGGTRSDGGKKPGADGGAAAANLRVVAGNLSSGNLSTYDSGEGLRIFAGLHADVALVQEFNYRTNSDADLQAFVTEGFGAGYVYYRESGVQIPNGVVSRYPIVTSGKWVDPKTDNRSFVYAKIDVPGPHPLWAVSLHLLTSSAANRAAEATSLVAQLGAVVADGDFIVLGGDLNTTTRTEPCITTLAQIVDAPGVIPVDGKGNDATNAPRNSPYDWVLAGPTLAELQVPTVIGTNTFPTGLVFDSRIYTPLGDVAPVKKTDSEATNMQHMAVVKDFALPE